MLQSEVERQTIKTKYDGLYKQSIYGGRSELGRVSQWQQTYETVQKWQFMQVKLSNESEQIAGR
jgi:hypothetical protein